MTESLEIIVEVIAIVSFAATIVNLIVIKPLRVSIDTLSLAVQELKKLLLKVEDDETELDKRVTVHETKINSLTERVDTLEGYHHKP